MKPKAVVWDIDDVLTPTSETFYESALRTHGQCPHPDHWSDYLWGQHIDTPEGYETAQYLIKHRIIETSIPFDYTARSLELTKEVGLKNVLLSARAWHPDPTKATQEWSARHVLDPLIDDMHFVLVEEPKKHRLEKLSEQYDIVAFVDDNPFHALSAIDIVPDIYLVRRQWNKEHHQEARVHQVRTALNAAIHIAVRQ